MSGNSPSPQDTEVDGIKQLLWGNNVKWDIFGRWSQGFFFSSTEPSALEQRQGGPCSVISTVQAFIIKKLLLEYEGLEFRYQMSEMKQNIILADAIAEIIMQSTSCQKFSVATLIPRHDDDARTCNGDEQQLNGNQTSSETHSNFHETVQFQRFNNSDDFLTFIHKNIHMFKNTYGILLFLYSVISTKGLEQVRFESDTNEPLIDATHGYGSQSLINLMITGRAVTYVWDYEQDVGGLKLKGLDKQSQIGFITLMEHLRYCTVGSFYKNPVHPVWVLASETHLTVLFSSNRRLVSPETKSEQAKRVFKKYDKDGNNFISSDQLQAVMSDLDLVSDEAYVDIMRKKLDSENLGIILLNAFMEEFFPREESSTPDTFELVHYNGLSHSNGGIKYHIGTAILLESDLRAMCESNPMLTCLQTKWPSIEVNWQDNITPSLN